MEQYFYLFPQMDSASHPLPTVVAQKTLSSMKWGRAGEGEARGQRDSFRFDSAVIETIGH
jgi:hypothetical protein